MAAGNVSLGKCPGLLYQYNHHAVVVSNIMQEKHLEAFSGYAITGGYRHGIVSMWKAYHALSV